MFVSLRYLIGWILRSGGSRRDLILENLALRQQLLSLHARHPRRRLSASHKLFWILLRRLWSGWKTPLVLVTSRTVVEWHRAGFRLYWKWLSKAGQVGGRKPVGKDIRALIFRMAAENPTWGAPRIHGELLKLGFQVSESTVSRWLRRAPRAPDRAQRWLTFLRNHRQAIAAMDFFTVPTITFGVLYCFFVIGHDRCKILRFNVNPQSERPLDCAADAGSVAIRYRSQVLVVRSRFEVRARGVIRRKGNGNPANPHRISQSLAERSCRTVDR